MIIIIDYIIYYAWCLVCFHFINKMMYKLTNSDFFTFKSYDFFGVGIYSIGFYILMVWFTDNGMFVLG